MNSQATKDIISRATKAGKSVLLPEADDPRVLRAARHITDGHYAHVTLIGDRDKIRIHAGHLGMSLADIDVIDHLSDDRRPKYVDELFERRKKRGMTRDNADKLLRRVVYYGGMMVGGGRFDGMVAGSICPTSETVRSAIFGVGLAPGNKTVSSCNLMNTAVPDVGVAGSLILADTGVVPEPTADQLADIAIAAADACRSLLNAQPSVAMLSYSTKGSAHSPSAQRVIEATKLVGQRRPDINVDGELQLDAAIVPEVARRKAPGSPVAGRANTLVFPDLASGNIGYKLVERLGGATALGPLLLGLAKPVNDLSRGCSAQDIALIVAITAVQTTY